MNVEALRVFNSRYGFLKVDGKDAVLNTASQLQLSKIQNK
jgi:hypothetical protein